MTTLLIAGASFMAGVFVGMVLMAILSINRVNRDRA